jgi:hypothetical protein
MRERPISFSPTMMRALLAGRKVQTLRLASSAYRDCVPGDRLWVREGFAPATGASARFAKLSEASYVLLRDGSVRFRAGPGHAVDLNDFFWKATWCPATIMPRWASRLSLVVEAVRLCRLSAVGRAEAVSEGPLPVPLPFGPLWLWPGEGAAPCLSPLHALRRYWNRVHATAGERWEDDPEVVVLRFGALRP